MRTRSVVVTEQDLDDDFYRAVVEAGAVAWDIETSGLNWTSDAIGTCQLAVGHSTNVLVLRGSRPHRRVMELLASEQVHKVFHHAAFDLRFMAHQWRVEPNNVACTKVASKILEPERGTGQHSLKPVLLRWLGVEISKDEQVSDWLARELTSSQLEYAAADVRHLLKLEQVLIQACAQAGVEPLLEASWRYLPTRVALDLRGSGDVFAY